MGLRVKVRVKVGAQVWGMRVKVRVYVRVKVRVKVGAQVWGI